MPEMNSSDAVQNEYIKIKEVLNSRPGAMTRIYGVYAKSTGGILAYVNWYPQWRQYTFRPEPGTVWNPDCLDFVSAFVKKLMEERKK